MKIGLIVFNNFTDLDLYLPWDLLNRVKLNNLQKNWNVEILSDAKELTSATGLTLKPTKPLSFTTECNAIFICSGSETRQLIKDEKFLNSIRLDESKQFIAAIDSGALILGALGLLKDKKATTYPTAFEELKSYCEVVQEPFVAVGNVATGARCLSGDKLALWLIEKLAGPEVSKKVHDSVRPL